MAISFPIKQCPHCHHDQFKNNIGMHGVSEITYNNQGKPIAEKTLSVNYSNIRDTWFCAQCNAALFRLNDCTVTN